MKYKIHKLKRSPKRVLRQFTVNSHYKVGTMLLSVCLHLFGCFQKSGVWGLMSQISGLRASITEKQLPQKLKQEDYRFKTSLGSFEIPCFKG